MLRRVLKYILLLLPILLETAYTACTPPDPGQISKPAKNSPDCWGNLSPQSDCTSYINNYQGEFLGIGVAKCISIPENNQAMNPRITVHVKQCGLGICSTDSGTIELNQCFWVGWYRFCSRLTPHDDAPRPVYENWPDTPKLGNNCPGPAHNPYPLRICGFEDSMDGRDTDANYSPFHKNQPVNSGAMTTSALGSNVASDFMTWGPLGGIISGIVNLVKYSESYYNQVVIKNIGCIDIPLAPGPPPFCRSLDYLIEPGATRVCSAEETPSLLNNCAMGTPINNSSNQYVASTFFKPMARVGFSKLLPKCTSSQTSDCVEFQNLTNTSQSLYYINKCSSNQSSSKPCASIKTQKVTLPSSQQSFRTYYIITDRITKAIASKGQWLDLSADTKNLYEIQLAGIDIGDYKDINLSYDTSSAKAEIGTNSTSGRASVSELSENGETIVGNSNFEICSSPDLNNSSVSPLNIVNWIVNNNARLLTSFQRAPTPKPIVAKCGEKICGQTLNCDSTFTDPKIVACLGEKQPSGEYTNCQCGILSKNQPTYYLHGQKFETLITDEKFANWRMEYPDPAPQFTENHEHLSGILFEQDANGSYNYVRGGTKICIIGYEDPVNKVLVKLKKLVSENNKMIKVYTTDQRTALNAFPSKDPLDVIPFTKASGNVKEKYFENGDLIGQYPGRQAPPPTPGYSSQQIINQSTEALRSMSALEEGLCISISQPNNCPALSEVDSSWAETAPGSKQTGICNTGYSSANGKAPTRFCTLLNDSGAWGTITNPCTKIP